MSGASTTPNSYANIQIIFKNSSKGNISLRKGVFLINYFFEAGGLKKENSILQTINNKNITPQTCLTT